jgi:hypothetical protein
VAGRRRPTARHGTFYLDQVEATVIPAPTLGVGVCALTLSEGRTDQRPTGRTQPQARGRGRPGLFRKGARAPPKHQGPQPRSRLRCGGTADPNGHPVPSGCVPLAGVGCAALVDHLRATSWPPKFRPHLPEKYDETSNPSEFLQVYVTAITAAGGNTAVMTTYFHVALSGPARTWLMNLAPGSIYSWEELCARFVANFASAYQQHGVEAHLHAVRQEPGETLRTFISRFTKVRGTIPRISDASIITAFRQGVRDEKMLEKLATHDMETVSTLFVLADKCARAAEGRAWHSAPQTGAAQSGGSGAVPRDGKKKKKKDRDYQRSRSTALVVAAATGGRGDRNKRPRPQRGNNDSCPVHPNGRHNAAECREIIDLAKRVSERREQSSKDDSPPRRRPGKEKVDDDEVAAVEWDLGYQSPEGDLKDVFAGGSYSGGDN